MSEEHIVCKMERRPPPETFADCPTCAQRPIIQQMLADAWNATVAKVRTEARRVRQEAEGR